VLPFFYLKGFNMRSQKIQFNNAQNQTLVAYIDWPVDGKPVAYALFAHCFTCTKNLKANSFINRALVAQGIAVMRFDFTGLGESEGDFADTNFTSNVSDLVAAADYMQSQWQAPELLIGHSLGGPAILIAATQIASSKAIVTIASPCDPEHVQHRLANAKTEIEQTGIAQVNIGGRNFNIKKQFLDDLRQHSMLDTISNLQKALLILHSPVDNTVDIENASRIFSAAKHPKSFISLDQADHLLSSKEDAFYVGRVIASWAARYLALDTRKPRKPEKIAERVVVRIAEDHYFTEINANGHDLIADEPKSLGGQNFGPTPYELLIAALGACTAITLRMYADHKKIPVEEICVVLKHEKIHAEDCDTCQGKTGKIDHIQREIEIIGAIDDKQRQRLLEIADRCPVHKSIRSETLVTTQLKS